MQFSAALYGPKQYMPAAMQLQQTVQGLRDAVYSTITEIKSLREVSQTLMEQVQLVRKGKKNELLKSVRRKRQACTKAHIDCLVLRT